MLQVIWYILSHVSLGGLHAMVQVHVLTVFLLPAAGPMGGMGMNMGMDGQWHYM